MMIEATPGQIRVLLRLAERNEGAEGLTPGDDGHDPDEVPRGLPRLLLDRYRSLLEAGRSPAVVAIERGACSGCHVRLPTMMEYRARRAPALYTCPHCRRMLYAPELVREGANADEGKTAARRGPSVGAGERS
jgi:hypothetical protein